MSSPKNFLRELREKLRESELGREHIVTTQSSLRVVRLSHGSSKIIHNAQRTRHAHTHTYVNTDTHTQHLLGFHQDNQLSGFSSIDHIWHSTKVDLNLQGSIIIGMLMTVITISVYSFHIPARQTV